MCGKFAVLVLRVPQQLGSVVPSLERGVIVSVLAHTGCAVMVLPGSIGSRGRLRHCAVILLCVWLRALQQLV